MKIEKITEIQKRWRAGWGANIALWQAGPDCDLSDKGRFLARDVPAMIEALKDKDDKRRL